MSYLQHYVMRKKIILFFLFLASYCNPLNAQQQKYPIKIEEALKKAGKNKASLEHVLHKYRNDKERFSAACFLIENMPFHAQMGRIEWVDPIVEKIIRQNDSTYYNMIKNYSDNEQESNPLHNMLKQMALKSATKIEKMKLKEPHVIEKNLPDIAHLNGAFVQRQIENAFLLRNQTPRLRNIPLSDFFEYILAYRAIPDYPLITDNKTLQNFFSKYLKVDTCETAHIIAERYNRAVWWLSHWGGLYQFENSMGWRELFFLDNEHDCIDIANYAALTLRACGWPAAVEYNTAYKTFAGRHYCVALPSVNWRNKWHAYKGWQAYSPQSELPKEADNRFKKCLNIFRLHFAPTLNCPYHLKANNEPIPEELESPFIEDVTSNYTSTTNIELPLSEKIPNTYQLAYLASFIPHSGLTVVTWGKIDRKRHKIIFENVVTNHIYFPVFVDYKRKLIPFDTPFKLEALKNKSDTITKLSPYYHTLFSDSLSNSVKTNIIRKYPRKPQMYKLAKSSVGTYIIASNSEKFSQADTLAVLKNIPEDVWTDIPLNLKHAYRYYRICAPQKDPHLHMSEIQFLSITSRGYDNTIVPTLMDSNKYRRLMDEPLEKCKWKAEYDGNYQTAPEQWPNVTLRLSKPQYVDCIHFMIKNADNHVRDKHFYVLYQWTDNGWIVICQGYANNDNLPILLLKTNTLYWLSDLTEGTEELPFFINKNGEQYFPHSWLLEE